MRTQDKYLQEGVIAEKELSQKEQEFLSLVSMVKGYKKNFDEFMDHPENLKGNFANQIKDLFDAVEDAEKEYKSKPTAKNFPDDKAARKQRLNFFKLKIMRMKQKLPLLKDMAKKGGETTSKKKVESAQNASKERKEQKYASERQKAYSEVKGKVEAFKNSKDFKSFGERVRSHMTNK